MISDWQLKTDALIGAAQIIPPSGLQSNCRRRILMTLQPTDASTESMFDATTASGKLLGSVCQLNMLSAKFMTLELLALQMSYALEPRLQNALVAATFKSYLANQNSATTASVDANTPSIELDALLHDVKSPLQGALLTTELLIMEFTDTGTQLQELEAIKESIKAAINIVNGQHIKPQ